MMPESYDPRDERYIESRVKYLELKSRTEKVMKDYSVIFNDSGRVLANDYLNLEASKCIHGDDFADIV